MKTLIAFGAVCALGAGIAMAQDTQQQTPAPDPIVVPGDLPPESTPTSDAPNPDEEVVCRAQETTGSRTRRERICMTRSQWVAQRQAARDEVGRIQRGTDPGCQPGTGC